MSFPQEDPNTSSVGPLPVIEQPAISVTAPTNIANNVPAPVVQPTVDLSSPLLPSDDLPASPKSKPEDVLAAPKTRNPWFLSRGFLEPTAIALGSFAVGSVSAHLFIPHPPHPISASNRSNISTLYGFDAAVAALLARSAVLTARSIITDKKLGFKKKAGRVIKTALLATSTYFSAYAGMWGYNAMAADHDRYGIGEQAVVKCSGQWSVLNSKQVRFVKSGQHVTVFSRNVQDGVIDVGVQGIGPILVAPASDIIFTDGPSRNNTQPCLQQTHKLER